MTLGSYIKETTIMFNCLHELHREKLNYFVEIVTGQPPNEPWCNMLSCHSSGFLESEISLSNDTF